MNVIDKKTVAERVKTEIGNAFMKFDAKPDCPCACSIGVYEDIEDSKWRGKWTETIRRIVKQYSAAACVSVNPLPFCHRTVVWYRVEIAV